MKLASESNTRSIVIAPPLLHQFNFIESSRPRYDSLALEL